MRDDLLQKLSTDEKLSLLSGANFWQTRSLPQHAIPAIWLSDGPHGLRKPARGDSPGLTDAQPATCFPTASALAATWDPELVAEVGRAIGAEARAMGVHVVLGPGLNIKRHPCGGRNFEYFSEDPLLSGRLAAALARGIQERGVGACLKHFVANNQEDHRMVVDALVDERSLREIYLRGFEIAVREAQPATVMACYNKINGLYGCEHPLLQEVLRDEWGFAGLVMSDWGAVDDRVAALRAGVDLEMPSSHGVQRPLLEAALASGALDIETVDRSVRRLLALQAQVGHDDPAPAIDGLAHHALARRAAAASCVLLKNQGELLPLAPDQRVAVIGALAQQPRYQGAGSSGVVPTRLVSIWEALSQALPRERIRYEQGYTLRAGEAEEALRDEALRVAEGADVVVIVAGLPRSYESEGFDRGHLDLPPSQQALIEAVAARCDRVVVVLANGAPVAMPWLDEVDAVLEAYLGGQAGGEGAVDVLLGTVNPSGKLAESFTHRLEDHASHAWFPGDGRQVQHREGLYVGYRWLDSAGIEPLFPFGHGLSYTRFDYVELEIVSRGETIAVEITVENVGERRGAEVVQLYLHRPDSRVPRPTQELRGFDRIELDPGERRRVRLELSRRDLAHWCARRSDWVVEPGEIELRVGASSRDIRLRGGLHIEGDALPEEASAPASYLDPTLPFEPSDEDFAQLLGRPLPSPEGAGELTQRSTFGDIRGGLLGGLLYRIAVRKAEQLLGVGDDPMMKHLAETAVREMPLRSLAATAGLLSWRNLHALLALLQGRPVEALRRALREPGPSTPARGSG
jgi:beta-glucosidase